MMVELNKEEKEKIIEDFKIWMNQKNFWLRKNDGGQYIVYNIPL